MQRREFVLSALGAAVAGTLLPTVLRAERPLRILVLGGTRFLGPHMAEYALARGHTLTFFNRGKTNPGVLPSVERIQGDRNGQLDGLKGRKWDAVIDNSGYVPRHVRAECRAAQGVGAALPVHLDRVRLCEFRGRQRRGLTGRQARRPNGREGRRRDLWPAQGAV